VTGSRAADWSLFGNAAGWRYAIVCPFYFTADSIRHDVTRRIFRHYAEMPFPFIGVGSEGDTSRRLFGDVFGACDRYVEYPQDFDCFAERVPGAGCEGLRRKFDYAIQQAREWDPDYVFCTGSDDFVPTEFYNRKHSADLIGVGGEGASTNLWHTGTHGYAKVITSGFEWKGAHLLGGPLGFSRALLDELEWAPFALPNCEVGAEILVRERGGTIDAWPGSFWQVKTEKVLNPIGLFRHRYEWCQPDDAYRTFRARYDALGCDSGDGSPLSEDGA
jgi:hypothetical protein